MRQMTPEAVVLDELGNYYNGDVLPHPLDRLGDDDADVSAARIVRFHPSEAKAVAVLLRDLASNPHHQLHVTIERQTLMGWNGDPQEWVVFERLARRMAETIDSLLEADDVRGGTAG
jgi:hypothetical protein